MIAVDLGRFAATSVLNLDAGTPQTWTNAGPETAIMGLADADTLLSLTGPATPEAGFLLRADTYVRFRLDAGAELSALSAGGAAILRLTRAGEA